MTILQIIQAIIAKKKANNIEPAHALDSEITKYIKEENLEISLQEMRKELNKLVREMKIVYGHTINNKWIKIK